MLQTKIIKNRIHRKEGDEKLQGKIAWDLIYCDRCHSFKPQKIKETNLDAYDINCHPKPFLHIVGFNNITMSEIVQGKSCGVCHGKVSFPLNDCLRCHQDKTK